MFENETEAEILRSGLARKPYFSSYDAYKYFTTLEDFYSLEEYKRFLDYYDLYYKYPEVYVPLYNRYDSYYEWKLNRDLEESRLRLAYGI